MTTENKKTEEIKESLVDIEDSENIEKPFDVIPVTEEDEIDTEIEDNEDDGIQETVVEED